jgi:hypothetical protein
MSEDKVRRKDMCWSVGDILGVLESCQVYAGPASGRRVVTVGMGNRPTVSRSLCKGLVMGMSSLKA